MPAAGHAQVESDRQRKHIDADRSMSFRVTESRVPPAHQAPAEAATAARRRTSTEEALTESQVAANG